MNYEELFKKYQALLLENSALKKEIANLQAQPGIDAPKVHADELSVTECRPEILESEAAPQDWPSAVDNTAQPAEKVKLFMSLFRGRTDVYAKGWEDHKKGTAGYSPVCLNQWQPGLCNKKQKVSCFHCKNKNYAALDEQVITDHLRGREGFVAGIYPLCPDETCYFLAIDFDGEEWEKDISVLRDICLEFRIPLSVERSRSGNGAHAWFFFASAVPAALARKLGSALLTHAMTQRHEIRFKSYDRFFPNQDTLPKGGLGNLIALPLQKAARNNHNSVFIDENGRPYKDQWAYLSTMQKLAESDIEILTSKLCCGNELGELRKDEEGEKPWEGKQVKLLESDFPENIEIVKANMLFIPKAGFSHRALNYLKRLAE